MLPTIGRDRDHTRACNYFSLALRSPPDVTRDHYLQATNAIASLIDLSRWYMSLVVFRV